jgi:hypothetical protein
MLPNDTDLSETAILGKPAMNFAFIGGVQRYHTAEDDVAHLSMRSLQHHGNQAYALARAFADGPLPRPETGDAAFFDLPLVGLIVYPIGWSLPIALLGLIVVIAGVVLLRRRDERWARGVAVGAGAFVASILVALVVNLCLSFAISRIHAAIGGAPEWSPIYGAAFAFSCVAIVLFALLLARRFTSSAALHLGALTVLALLTVGVAMRVPGVSFLFAWPLIFAAAAGLLSDRGAPLVARVVAWVAAAVTLLMLAPTIHAMVVVALGLDQVGTALLSLLAVIALWLIAPLLHRLASRWWGYPLFAAQLAVILLGVGLGFVRTKPRMPAGSTFSYVIDSDSLRAWLAGGGTTPAVRDWIRRELEDRPSADPSRSLGMTATPPAWLTRGFEPRRIKPAPMGSFVAPTVTLLSDSVTAAGRVVRLRVVADTGTLAMNISADSGAIINAAVDDRSIDRSRYRSRSARWSLEYIAPDAAGFTLRLTLAASSKPALNVLARRPGIPQLGGLTIPVRPAGVLPIQNGDQTIVYKRVQL